VASGKSERTLDDEIAGQVRLSYPLLASMGADDRKARLKFMLEKAASSGNARKLEVTRRL
jgi:hypothetical protein